MKFDKVVHYGLAFLIFPAFSENELIIDTSFSTTLQNDDGMVTSTITITVYFCILVI